MGSESASALMELSVKERGAYRLDISCRVPEQGSLAQVAMSLSQDKQLLGTISLTGENKEWVQQEIMLNPAFQNTLFLKFYFSQGGMELKNARLALAESCWLV